MIPTSVIDLLIAIGRTGDPNDSATVERLNAISGHSSINRKHWYTWNELTDDMPTDDLVHLTKGLVLADNCPGWGGGSVAGAIWTFRRLEERDPVLAGEIAEWTLPRTRNPWLPFGSQNHAARSVEEFRRVSENRSRRISAGIVEEK